MVEKLPRATRLASWLIAIGVVLLTGAVFMLAPTLIAGADLAIYDNHFRLRGARSPNPRVAIVAIDESSLKEIVRDHPH